MRHRNWGCLGACVLALILDRTVPSSATDSAAVRKLFSNPPREFSSGPLWVWNDDLTEQQITDTLADLAAQNVKQVFVHPRPGLMTPYLSADWFRLWKAALAQAERLDMNVWIYDENSYPSGFAGGWVPETMPQARGRGLSFRQSKSAPAPDPALLCAYRVNGDQVEDVTSDVRTGATLPDGLYISALMQRAGNSPWNGNRCYVDLLYPGVTEKFLDITLNAYRTEIGGQFGQRVPGIFTDEPNIHSAGSLPWTEDLPEQFKQRWGYDLLPHLLELERPVRDWRKVRHDYFSSLSQLFIERWAKPYHDRCESLGLEMTGHYWEHEWPNCTGVPDNMAMYAWEQRPTIDCLMNQYAENTHAQFGNIRSPRELNSIANQLGKARTLCEVYGAGGWDLRFEDMKRQADWLGVLGVNTFDQHLSYVTIRGARKRDHPQSFSYHEPWWESYHVMGGYLERLSVAASQGQQSNDVLVLEPTTTAWMYQGDSPALQDLGNSFFGLLRSLEAAQIEYDLGCEDVLARHGAVRGASFVVGKRAYATVVLPPSLENLDSRTWELLNEFTRAGGKVIRCESAATERLLRRDGAPPDNATADADTQSRWRTVKLRELHEVLAAEASKGFAIVRTANDQGILFHMRRRLDDGELLLLVNTSIENSSAGVIHSNLRGVERWTLEDGAVAPYPFEAGPSGIRANYELPPCGSLVLFLSDASVASPTASPAPTPIVVQASGTVEVHREQPNVLVLDYVDITAGGESRTNVYFYQANQFAFQKHGLERNPWDSAVQFRDELIRKRFAPGTGFEATYHFQIESAVPEQLALVVERPDLYRITCNGREIKARHGAWWLDKAFGRIELLGAARVGPNEITIKADPFTIEHELEPAYILGNFTLKTSAHGFVIAPDQALALGRWNEQAHPFYSAGVRYREVFQVQANPGSRYQVKAVKWRGSVAQVFVNGHAAGCICYAPWQCDVSQFVRPGSNTVEVVVIGTLKNTLGPHHGKPALGTAWPGMFQKAPSPGPPPGSEYDTVGYGLFDPFTLIAESEP